MFPEIEYSFYKEIYKGALTEEEFAAGTTKAHEFLNELSSGRYLDSVETDRFTENQMRRVKLCICALVEYDYADRKRIEANRLSSESVGPHSKGFKAVEKKEIHIFLEKKQICYGYLLKTGIFYRGLGVC